MKKFEGKCITEVWDYRLSVGIPQINRTGKTWVVYVFPKTYEDGQKVEPLISHDTGIKVEEGDTYDTAKVAKCYEWLYSIRDRYSLPDIEERKPHVVKIHEAINALAALGAAK